jgi:hypothetical protein
MEFLCGTDVLNASDYTVLRKKAMRDHRHYDNEGLLQQASSLTP